MVKDVVQLPTPVFRPDQSQNYIMFGNLEVLSVSSTVYRNDAIDGSGTRWKERVLNLILASLNQNPFLRQAIVSMVFGDAERLLIDGLADDSALDTPALPSLPDAGVAQ